MALAKTRFNFHEECNLVLLPVPNYRGKPLSIHSCTRIEEFYSIVEAAAI